MIFHSLDYLVFLSVLVPLYWTLPHRLQNFFLLAASLFFYGYAEPTYVVLLTSVALLAWASGLGVAKYPKYRALILAGTVCGSFGALTYFKYANFLLENLKAVGLLRGDLVLNVVLPVGISFFTFQAVSYVMDVWRGEIEARKSFLDFFLFKAFFPQLVAGPIERAPALLPQVEHSRVFSIEKFRSGITLMLWGYVKKLVVADNVAVISNKLFALDNPTFPGIWVGVLAFAVQIYADFSAYTDIARGTAKLLGFELSLNFRFPYFSRSPQEFWRRWHISLSSWFRDYLYIPLGGSRRGELIHARNVLLTFGICGLWHGASWNYVIWGLYHGVLLILTRLSKFIIPERISASRWIAPFQILLTFVLTCFGWLLFRETNLKHLVAVLRLPPSSGDANDWLLSLFLALTVVFYAVPIILEPLSERIGKALEGRKNAQLAAQLALCSLCLTLILHFASSVSADFIYFQF